MRLLRKNRKGMSLVEVVVALTILGIVSVPISMLIITSMWTTKISKEQVEINAITTMVKENVVTAVKKQSNNLIWYAVSPTTDAAIQLRFDGVNYVSRNDLNVNDIYGNRNYQYSFDAEFQPDLSVDTASGAGIYISNRNIVKYNIRIKKNGKIIRSFNVQSNVID